MKGVYIKQTIKIIAFCLIGVLMFQCLYRVFSWKDTASDYHSSMETFYELEENSVDVLFLGSSHCYCSVDVANLWEKQGIAAYSLSISGQDLCSSYHCLVEALKTQKPKVVCLEMFYSALYGYESQGNLYRNLLPYRYSSNFLSAVDDIATEDERKDIKLKWPVIHTRYRELQREDFLSERAVYMSYSVETNIKSMDKLPVYTGEEIVPIHEETEKWLKEIIALTQENDIQLLCFLSPFYIEDYLWVKYRYVEKLLAEAGIPFLNFVDLQREARIDSKSDFTDWGHTNHYGAQKVTEYLGKYLKMNYTLDDKRGRAEYALWDENVLAREHEIQNIKLRSINEIGEYMCKLAELDDYTIVFSASGDYYLEGSNLIDRTGGQFWLEELIAEGGVGVRLNGEMLYATTEEQGFITKLPGVSDFTISRKDGIDSIIINGVNCSKVTDGVNIVVYDNVLGIVVDAVGFSTESMYTPIR
ncbi:MAG: hypothetical protein ACI4HQ_08640 [Acetatifactor sp.]